MHGFVVASILALIVSWTASPSRRCSFGAQSTSAGVNIHCPSHKCTILSSLPHDTQTGNDLDTRLLSNGRPRGICGPFHACHHEDNEEKHGTEHGEHSTGGGVRCIEESPAHRYQKC